MLGVTARLRSGTFAFTARRAEPLHHGHHGRLRRGGGTRTLVSRLSGACSPLELHLRWSGCLDLPQRPEVPETGARLSELPSSTLMSALVWNRTSTSWTSARRHHQIGYEGIVVAGVVPGHGHRRLFGFHRARSLRNRAVRGRGFEPRRAGSKPAGLSLADPRSARFRDQDSNLDCCVQSAGACH